MAYFAYKNITAAANCSITPDIIFKDARQACGGYIDALQICPTDSVTPTIRLQAANQTANCVGNFEASYGYPEYLANLTAEDPVAIEANPSCHYPDFLPIMQKACSFDISTMNITCSSAPNSTKITMYGGAWALCQKEAAVQYVRCTLQKSPEEVESCVTQNAVKVDWLPQIQTYTGAAKCPNINVYLIVQAIHILRHVLSSLFSILWWPPLWAKMQNKFRFLQRKQDGKKKAAELKEFHELPNHVNRASTPAEQRGGHPNRDPWTLETRYTLKATRLLQSIGREVLVAFLTVLVLEQTGIYMDKSSSFNEDISFYVVRPRPAPFLGLMGLFEPWSQKGLAELVVDGMLSFVAGTNVGMRYWGLVNHAPANPAAPVAELKTLAVGAIMTSIPAFAVLVITFLWSMGMVSNDNKGSRRREKSDDEDCGNFIAGLCIWTVQLCLIALFICILPLVAIVEIVAQTVVTIRRKLKERRGEFAAEEADGWERQKSRWEEPLTTTSGRFRVPYALFMLSSFVINMGNWLFFANYLKLEGEMYCPSGVPKITAIWVLVPLGIDVLFWAFRSWTGDTYFDTHTNQVKAPPT